MKSVQYSLIPGLLVIGSLAAAAVAAHHNPGFYFDFGAVVIHRDVTAMSFTPANPHGRLVYSMADADGAVREWVAELPANNMMRRNGVESDMIQPGDTLTIRGNPGRQGATVLRITHALLPSGHVATFYSPQGTGSLEDLQETQGR
ncbi:MAG: DUF6152 family protein [Rhodospirillaceae bacterium]|nr:DUF6152 family protein [Rhodospirillaceae bacterium]